VNSVMDLPRVTLAPLSIAGMGLLAAINIRWAFAVAALPMLLVGLSLATNRQARQLRTDPHSDQTIRHQREEAW
jgi:hypothetical protein